MSDLPKSMKQVAVLCVAPRSVYKTILGVDAYDRHRDARTFACNLPIVAHPPCRAWSPKLRHQAKPEPGEVELGLWCADVLRRCGGVLEQPRRSLLFDAAQLPSVGHSRGDLATIEVWQSWWGYPIRKPTWLCFSRVDLDKLRLPYRLCASRRDAAIFSMMSHQQRSQTCLEFAVWLVEAARMAKV